LRANNLQEFRFYELTGDLHEALHFSHFEESPTHPKIVLRNRISIGDEVDLGNDARNPAHGKITIHE
jgi:hypothetical protein